MVKIEGVGDSNIIVSIYLTVGMNKKTKITFEKMISEWKWRPIYNCPGRFKLNNVDTTISIDDLLGFEMEVKQFQTSKAMDMVLIVPFSDGGIISYKREDGSYIHTLNNEDGFKRKLSDLNIQL